MHNIFEEQKMQQNGVIFNYYFVHLKIASLYHISKTLELKTLFQYLILYNDIFSPSHA